MPSRGNGWQTPFSTRGRGRTLDVRWALDYPIHRPDRGKPKRLRVSSDRNAEETWLHRDRTESVLLQRSSRQSGSEKSPRSWHGGTAIQAWETGAESGLLGPRQNLPPSTSRSDSGAMQILANTDKHIDAVPISGRAERDFGVRSASASESRGWRFTSATKTPIGADTNSGFRGQAGRLVLAFRRGSFEVSVWDGRPLSCRGSRG